MAIRKLKPEQDKTCKVGKLFEKLNIKKIVKKNLSYKLTNNLFVNKCVKIVKKIRREAIHFIDEFKPFVRTVQYKGVRLYYSKGTSIVESNSANPVRFGGTYEPLETAIIVETLNNNSSPIFVDIGANIGLISMNVLAEVPKVVIHAFEPGPHQYSLLEKTVKNNGLENRVSLYQKAIGTKNGKMNFYMHSKKHSSGDGFLDTKRAGKTNVCSVDVTTLDTWWDAVGRPKVNTIKMDIEGAELFALKGAQTLMSRCRAVILLEIHPANLLPYPYSASDILAWLNEHEYHLKTISNEIVTFDNFSSVLKHETSFVATVL